MPNERAARDDLLAAAEHIRKLMAIADEIDELIPCGWLSHPKRRPRRSGGYPSSYCGVSSTRAH
jgi:hypothetical protein